MAGKVQGNRGKGRKRGARNYATRITEELTAKIRPQLEKHFATEFSVKRCVIDALERAGGSDYLLAFASSDDPDDRRCFLALCGRLIPAEIEAKLDQRVSVRIVKYTVTGSKTLDVTQAPTIGLNAAGLLEQTAG